MTMIQLQYAAHQIGMVRASKANALADWRAHQRAAAELREKIGPIYQPYPFPNRALVKALYNSLAAHLISRPEFACCIQNVMERHR